MIDLTGFLFTVFCFALCILSCDGKLSLCYLCEFSTCFRSFDKFKACYKPNAAACKDDVIFTMTFGTVENTVDYLCLEAFNGDKRKKRIS